AEVQPNERSEEDWQAIAAYRQVFGDDPEGWDSMGPGVDRRAGQPPSMIEVPSDRPGGLQLNTYAFGGRIHRDVGGGIPIPGISYYPSPGYGVPIPQLQASAFPRADDPTAWFNPLPQYHTTA